MQYPDHLIIVRAVQTCRSTPSQWDAWTASGEYLYLRYRNRFGLGHRFADRTTFDRLNCYEQFIAAADVQSCFEVDESEFDEQLGPGDITLTEFCRRAGYVLAGLTVAGGA